MIPQETLFEPVVPLPNIAVSACDTDLKSKDCVLELIEKYSNLYGFSQDMAIRVADCESNFRADALGDDGLAYGIYQFHEPTFEMFSKKLGAKLDYFNTEDNIKLAIWALANDKGNHWSCYRRISYN